MTEFFVSSPEIKSLQKSAVKVEGLQVEFRSLRSELRETSSVVSRMDATSVKSSDLAELRDRLSSLSNLNDKVFHQSSLLKDLQESLESQKEAAMNTASEVAEFKAAQKTASVETSDIRY